MKQQEKCYFCGTDKQVNEKLYIHRFINGKLNLYEVSVCSDCKELSMSILPIHYI